MAFETPWFLKSKTTNVGRANQIVEDKLQRSVTELEFKARKNIIKIDRRIDTVKKEYKTLTDDVDFSTDLDRHGRPLDPDVVRSRSTNDARPTRKQGKFLVHPKGSKSAHAGHKIKTKPRQKVTTQDIIDKLAKMKERELMTDWTVTPQMKGAKKVHKLEPIKGRVNNVPIQLSESLLIKTDTEINQDNEDIIRNSLTIKVDSLPVDDLHVIKSVTQANVLHADASEEKRVKKRKRGKKDKKKS